MVKYQGTLPLTKKIKDLRWCSGCREYEKGTVVDQRMTSRKGERVLGLGFGLWALVG